MPTRPHLAIAGVVAVRRGSGCSHLPLPKMLDFFLDGNCSCWAKNGSTLFTRIYHPGEVPKQNLSWILDVIVAFRIGRIVVKETGSWLFP